MINGELQEQEEDLSTMKNIMLDASSIQKV
jgi:hypothetical protein